MSLTYALGHLVSQPFVCKAFEFFLGVTLCCSPRQGTGGVLWQDWWSARGRMDEPLLCVVEGGRILIRRTQKPSNEIQQELLLGASHH